MIEIGRYILRLEWGTRRLWKGLNMVRHALTAVLILVAGGMSGCIVVSTERVEKCPPPGTVPADSTIAEIDAAGKLAFDHDRRDAYRRIAKRPSLIPTAQVYLIEAACNHLEFENARMDVFLALLENPCLDPIGEAALLERLDCLTFEHNKREILEAIGERASR